MCLHTNMLCSWSVSCSPCIYRRWWGAFFFFFYQNRCLEIPCKGIQTHRNLKFPGTTDEDGCGKIPPRLLKSTSFWFRWYWCTGCFLGTRVREGWSPSFIVIIDQGSYIGFLSKIVLHWVAVGPCANMDYNTGLSALPWGTPVVQVKVPKLTNCCLPMRESGI